MKVRALEKVYVDSTIHEAGEEFEYHGPADETKFEPLDKPAKKTGESAPAPAKPADKK